MVLDQDVHTAAARLRDRGVWNVITGDSTVSSAVIDDSCHFHVVIQWRHIHIDFHAKITTSSFSIRKGFLVKRSSFLNFTTNLKHTHTRRTFSLHNRLRATTNFCRNLSRYCGKISRLHTTLQFKGRFFPPILSAEADY